jgi:mannose-1-phosphate guanylyltransferase
LEYNPIFPLQGLVIFVKENSNGSPLKPVLEYTEKPDEANAQRFIDAKNYCLNSGVFVWSATEVLEGFKAHSPARFDWDDLGSLKSIYDRQP